MLRFVGILVVGSIVSILGQRPGIPTEYRSSPGSSRPVAPLVGSGNRPLSVGTFNANTNPTASPNPNAFNPNGFNLTFVISAQDLPNVDVLDNIDPYIKVYHTNKTNAEPEKFGTTEVIKDSPSGEFVTVFTFLWKKGQGQKWVLKVKDSDKLRDTTVGEALIDVDDYVAKGEKLNVTLKGTDGKAVAGSLLVQKTTPVSFRLYARSLPKMDPFGGKSDPFVKCYWRRGPKGDEIKFYETKVVNDVENVDWDETIEFPNYIKGTDLWWVFKVYDSDTTGEDELGEALVEIDPFVQKRQTKPVRLGKTGAATLSITPV